MPSLFNCYYYAPHNHCLLSRHLRADLEHIRSLGADAISICVQEQQLTNWHSRRLRNVVELARSVGLQVYAVPNRWCGMVCGWLDGVSEWSVQHAHTFWTGERPVAVSDPRFPEVREHFERHLRMLITDYPFDGIVWDEPRSVRPELVQFLDEMSGVAKSLRPNLVISMFAESSRLVTVAHQAATRHIDYLGSDGHVRDPKHQMHRMKTTIFEAHGVFHPALTQAGKKTMFLLEGQRHRDEDLEAYLEALERALQLPMDQLMFYYSAHEMSLHNEERFNRATWDGVSALIARSKK